MNCGPLELKATALPTEPQPLPAFSDCYNCTIGIWSILLHFPKPLWRINNKKKPSFIEGLPSFGFALFRGQLKFRLFINPSDDDDQVNVDQV